MIRRDKLLGSGGRKQEMNGLVTVTDNNRSVIDNDPLVVQRAARLLREVVERDWTEKTKPIALLRALTPSQNTEVPMAVGRWIRLLEDGIASAPLYWQPIARLGDNVLELRRDPGGAESPTVHLVRYVADCPLCGKEHGRSAVRIESGRIEFFGRRIVGRCIHAPNALVWGFDHITRKGRFLR
jgi:hypothetical protein